MQEETTIKERIFERYHIPNALYNVVDYIAGWARKYSIWPIHFVTGCCSPEFMQVSGSRFDMERLGILTIGQLIGHTAEELLAAVGVMLPWVLAVEYERDEARTFL